jgi:hypothetical protein
VNIQVLDDVRDFLDSLPKKDDAKIAAQLKSLEIGQTGGLVIKTLEPISKVYSSRVAISFPASARRDEEGVASGYSDEEQRRGAGKLPQPAWDIDLYRD